MYYIYDTEVKSLIFDIKHGEPVPLEFKTRELALRFIKYQESSGKYIILKTAQVVEVTSETKINVVEGDIYA